MSELRLQFRKSIPVGDVTHDSDGSNRKFRRAPELRTREWLELHNSILRSNLLFRSVYLSCSLCFPPDDSRRPNVRTVLLRLKTSLQRPGAAGEVPKGSPGDYKGLGSALGSLQALSLWSLRSASHAVHMPYTLANPKQL